LELHPPLPLAGYGNHATLLFQVQQGLGEGEGGRSPALQGKAAPGQLAWMRI